MVKLPAEISEKLTHLLPKEPLIIRRILGIIMKI